jgi:hypothetical protein
MKIDRRRALDARDALGTLGSGGCSRGARKKRRSGRTITARRSTAGAGAAGTQTL